MVAVTSSGTATVTLPTDEQILITREFDAPKHLVYKAWTTPELVRRWWSGLRGEMTVAEIDLRVGGKWRYVMIAARRVRGRLPRRVPRDRPERADRQHRGLRDARRRAAAGEDEPLNIVTFTEVDGRTIAHLLVQTTSKELRDAIVDSGMEAGMQEGDGSPRAGRDLATFLTWNWLRLARWRRR